MPRKLPIRISFIASFLFFCHQQPIAQTKEFQRFEDSLIRIFPMEKTDSAKGFIAMNIARVKMGDAQNTGNWDRAIEWAQKGLFFSKKGNYKFGTGRCNWQLGMCWKMKGNYPEAIRYFTDALKASFKNNNPTLTVVSCNWLCDCYLLLGNYPEALKTLQLALKTLDGVGSGEIYDKTSLKDGLILKMGDLQLQMNNYSQAIISYEKLQVDNQSANPGTIYARIATAQIGLKKYDTALVNLQKALTFLPELLNRKSDIEYKGILGNFYLQIGEAFCKIGSIKQGSERISAYNQAINHLSKCIPLLTNGAGGKEDLITVYALLKEAYEAIHDYQNALRLANLFTDLKDSLYNKTIYSKLADQQAKYKTELATVALNAKQEKERIKQDALRDKMLTDQKLEEDQKLTDERISHVKLLGEEKLKYEKTMAAEIVRQEKMRAEKQQVNSLLFMSLFLVAVSAVFLIFYLRQRNQKIRAVEKAESIHKMAELELQSLRSQLNPHFMFNSLNSIQELILLEENDKSHIYLSRFSKLLRMLLENAEKPFIPLQKELDFLQLYLDLENLRVPKLQYSISIVPGIDTEETLIPNLILQPYIENAIWHGLAHKENDKQLKIRIYRENGAVNYEIEDNGVGRKRSSELKSLFRKNHISKGMELLTKRFKLLNEEYKTSIHVNITDVMNHKDVAGTLVNIRIPYNCPGNFHTES